MTTADTKSHGEPIDLIDAAKVQFEDFRLRNSDRVGGDSASRASEAGASRFSSDAIPGYAVGSEIHRGGQGVVYQATQSSTGRTVAIKMMRQGPMASRDDHLRLDREVQILGSLNHPHIVGVLDSGSTAGHRYFVMEYVDGQPLDVFARGMAIKDILALFAKICDAVHAAHLRGVIHRDLKPGNILIDKQGEPNILDFGLAKIISGDEKELDSQTVVTVTGQFVGSLPWASPEQASAPGSGGCDDHAIDIRSDVYSLGVMLYQVLTGAFPYRVIGGMRDILENIIKTQPIRPSSHNRAINDELETIILKCLCKEPERRYQSAGELGRDFRHYLSNEPIEAKRDSFNYVLRKQLHRHRAAVAVAAAFAVLIVTGLIVSLSLWQAAVRERDETEVQRTRAVAETAKSDAVNRFLHDMLASANPESGRRMDITVRETLDEASLAIDAGALRTQSEVEGSIRLTMGEAYLWLGQFQQADHHLQTAVDIVRRLHGVDHPNLAEYLNALGALRREQADLVAAEQLHRQALDILQRAHGEDHADVATTLILLARTLQESERFGEAEQCLERSLAIRRRVFGDTHPETAKAKVQLALSMHGGEKPIALLREAIEIDRAALGPNHPEVLRNLQYLAGMLHMQRDYAGAERTYIEGIDLTMQMYGPNHPYVIRSVQNLAFLYQSTNQHQQRIELLKRHRAGAEGAFGAQSVSYAEYLNSMGAAMSLGGHDAEGIAVFEQAISILRGSGRESDGLGAECHNSLAIIHLHAGEYEQAEFQAREALALHDVADAPATTGETKVGSANPRAARMHAQAQSLLGEALTGRGQFKEAEANLLAGYDGLVESHATSMFRSRAIERVVQLYDSWETTEPNTGKAEQAAVWRDKLAAMKTPPQ